MNANTLRMGAAAALLVSGLLVPHRDVETKADASCAGAARATISARSLPNGKIASSWNQKAAAAYLDSRESWWMAWPRASRDHGTFCVSCHTAVPYAISRSALRTALREQNPSPNEQKLIDNVTKRVRLWKEVAPFYSDADRGQYKSIESRGTESVLNALILASNDASGGGGSEAADGRLSVDTRVAFDNMWAEQIVTGDKAGSWRWLRFANEPWEADDSDYYGAALAAVAAGIAPGNYQLRPEIQRNLTILREYLTRESAHQTLMNRVNLLWASTKLRSLLNAEQRLSIADQVLSKQQADGGWSSSSLSGAWTRHDGTQQETKSDGYATALILLVLEQPEISREKAPLERARAWLLRNQNHADGSWPAYSLNKNEEHHIGPETVHFMTDAATAYAVLALTSVAPK